MLYYDNINTVNMEQCESGTDFDKGFIEIETVLNFNRFYTITYQFLCCTFCSLLLCFVAYSIV